MRSRGEKVVVFIGAFKLMKAGLLIVLGLAGVFELQQDVAHLAFNVVAWIGGFAGRRVVLRLLGRVWALDHRAAKVWGTLALGYAAVFLTEGVGLILKRHWAEWLTVVVTASFVPLEIYELVDKFRAAKVMALTLNVAILIYLVRRLFQDRRAQPAVAAP